MRRTSTVCATSKDSRECGLRVGHTCLVSSGSCPWIELLAIFKSLSSLLEESCLSREHITDELHFVSYRTTLVHAVFSVAEVAEGRYLVEVALKLDHSRWTSILDDKFDGSQCLQNATPHGTLSLKFRVQELANFLDVLTDRKVSRLVNAQESQERLTCCKLHRRSAIALS